MLTSEPRLGRWNDATSAMCVEVLHLRYVVAAAENRSFRRAVAALNITQPIRGCRE